MATRLLVHRYAPRGGCLAAFNDRSDALLLSGPAGTGKSRALLEKLHVMMLNTPGARGLIVRKIAESLTSTALVTWREHVVPEALEAGLLDFYGGSAESPAQYRYSNGSRVSLGGMNKPTKIMSSEYDVIYVQEAIELTVTDWEALETRLRNGRISFQQLMADTNPDKPTHWLNARCNSGAVRMIESRHTDNPRIYDLGDDGTPSLTDYGRAYMGRLDRLTGPRRARLRDGQWVAAEGQVYPEFDASVHMVDPFVVPEDWPRFWSIDFGWRHPFVCSMWAEAPDGELYRYREHYGTERTVEDWAEVILASVREHTDGPWPEPDADYDPNRPRTVATDERGRPVPAGPPPAHTSCSSEDHWRDPTAEHHYRWREPRPNAVICDHDAEGRVVLERHIGMSTLPAHKRVNEGIDAVKQRMADKRIYLMRGVLVEPDAKLVEDLKPTCTEAEIPGYRWNDNKEAPVKIEDDGCDCMRYVVVYRDLKQKSQHVRF